MKNSSIAEKKRSHIVFVHSWPRYPSENRWDNELVNFEKFIDYEAYCVSYIGNHDALTSVLPCEQEITHFEIVKNLNDYDRVKKAFGRINSLYPVDQVIALSEFHLMTAARLRSDFQLIGHLPDDVDRYRDKVKMKEYIAANNIRVPHYTPLVDSGKYDDFISLCGFPLIIKPRDGAAASGVSLIKNKNDLTNHILNAELDKYELEEYIDHQLYHLDGYYSDEEERSICFAFQYIGRPLDFNHGNPVGSVLVTDRQFTEYCRDFAVTCCKALGISDSPFHLEVFYDANNQELIFLELGARVGGADIPYVINDFFNINIYEIWIGRLLGGNTKIPDQPKIDKSVGFVLFPRPINEPIITIESSQFINIVPEVYRELVPKKGDILSGKQTYNSILPGRYLLKGEIEASVSAAISRIISDFNYKWEQLDDCNDIIVN